MDNIIDVLLGVALLSVVIWLVDMYARKHGIGVQYAALRQRRELASGGGTPDMDSTPGGNGTPGGGSDASADSGTAHAKPDFGGMKTRQLCKAVLHELNCTVEEDSDDDTGRMDFKFQGEQFCMTADDGCLLVTIYDFSWGSVSLDDLDDVSRLRKVINSINFRFGGLAVVYSIDTDRNRMVVHTKRQLLMTPEIPNITDYMTAMLTGFFEVQRALMHELDRLRMGNKDE